MRATLKRLHSPDVGDLSVWSPPEEDFGFLLEAMIGPSDFAGEEAFALTVCTPAWFKAHRLEGTKIRAGVHTLFVNEYDYRALRAFIERAVHGVEADDWPALARKLAWLGQWVFAD
jgi:hypothetical protein